MFILSTYCYMLSEGRKKTKDGKIDKKKRSGNSSEEDSAGTVRGNKRKKQKSGSSGGSGSGTGNGAKATSGEGSYHHDHS